MAEELEYLNERIASVYESKVTDKNVMIKYYVAFDNNGKKYWCIDTKKDVFKGLKTNKEIEKAAYNFIIGLRDKKTIIDTID